MRLNRLVMALTCTGFFAACGTDSATTVAETAAALESVQSDFCAFRAQADACRSTYDACIAVQGADPEACRTALHDCLPPPPPRPEGAGGGRCEGMGGGEGDGGVRPPPPFGAPPPPRDGGEGPRGGGHHGSGPGAPIVQPLPAAVQACRDALTACQAAAATDVTCKDTERACVRDAFRAAFEAACADAPLHRPSCPEESNNSFAPCGGRSGRGASQDSSLAPSCQYAAAPSWPAARASSLGGITSFASSRRVAWPRCSSRR